jgi:hypothetical protein
MKELPASAWRWSRWWLLRWERQRPQLSRKKLIASAIAAASAALAVGSLVGVWLGLEVLPLTLARRDWTPGGGRHGR